MSDSVNRTGLAEHFGVSLTTIDNWIRRGCPYQKKGGRGSEWEFSIDDVDLWRSGGDSYSDYPDEDSDPKNPGTVFLHTGLIAFALSLAEKLKWPEDRALQEVDKFIAAKPGHLYRLENTINEWLMHGPKKSRIRRGY